MSWLTDRKPGSRVLNRWYHHWIVWSEPDTTANDRDAREHAFADFAASASNPDAVAGWYPKLGSTHSAQWGMRHTERPLAALDEYLRAFPLTRLKRRILWSAAYEIGIRGYPLPRLRRFPGAPDVLRAWRAGTGSARSN